MNKILNKFLLAGDNFIPRLYLRQPRFTYIACGPFTTQRETIRRFRETGDLKHVHRNKLDKLVLLMMLRILISKI